MKSGECFQPAGRPVVHIVSNVSFRSAKQSSKVGNVRLVVCQYVRWTEEASIDGVVSKLDRFQLISIWRKSAVG